MNTVSKQLPSANHVARGLLALALGGAAGCQQAVADTTSRGQLMFEYCRPCHGADGGGNVKFAAPPIAGLPAWYVEAQVKKFRAGVRGAHFDDVEGQRMRPMAMTLHTEPDITAVAGYISKLPKTKPIHSNLGGDASKGQAAFMTCMACHGPTGAGNEALMAPPIAGQADWYVFSQLNKFKKGIRGANPADASGATMRPMAMTLADDAAMKDVAAYVATMPR
ncbi:MAG: c-type cytochrome [Deltaproteobacteria bacterium]|nr:c-type cytochrome [Deltaproteobacteria bacterium]